MDPSPRSRVHRLLGLPPRLALGFAAAIAAVLAAGFFSSVALSGAVQSSVHVEGAWARQLAVEELESALLVAHTALDAFVGTRDPAHRERHLEATARVAPALGRLAANVSGALGPEERLLERLGPEIATVRAEHEAALALADAGAFERALALRRGGDGRRALARAKARIEEIELACARVAGQRVALRARSVRVSEGVLVVTTVALLVLIALAVRLARDEVRGREEHEAARERALALQQRLMAVVSHDLRNPLTGILAAGWALSRAALPKDEAQLARRVVSAGRRMERLIRDLLDWSRLHGDGEIPVALCDADVAEVCRRVSEEISDAHSGRVGLAQEGDTVAVFDPARLEQIVANLLTNALKYAPPDSPVSVRVVGREGEVRVEVKDAGPGLPPEVRARLFEPFRRGRGAAAGDGGLGLGLFIVRTLAEALGARVEVDTAEGRGTTFAVCLPRRPAQAPAAAAPGRTA